MPQPRRKAAAVLDEADAPQPNGHVEPPPKPLGHVPAKRWVRTTAKWQEDEECSVPFSAEIDVAGLSMGNTTWLWEPERTLGDLWQFFGTRVRDWNATAYDHESKAVVVAPSPAEIGWKAFALVDQVFTTYLLLMLSDAIGGGDERPKGKTTSESPPAPGAGKS